MPNPERTVAPRPAQEVAAKPAANKVLDLIGSEKARKQYAMALPKHITPDLLVRICLTAINKTPKLADCTQESLFGSIMDLAQMGLVPDNRTAYLVPFWNGRKKANECQYIVGYQGFIELAYRHPLVKGIRFAAVYAKDYFEFEDGLESKLVHRPTDEEDPGELTHAWAVCELEGGGRTFVVIGKRQIRTAMSNSRDSDKDYSPWQKHKEAMWAKTAVRALAKRMPRSAELIAAIEADDKQANAHAIDASAMSIPTGAIGGGAPTALEDARNATNEADQEPERATEKTIEADVSPAAESPEGAAPTLAENRAQITRHLYAMNIGKTRFVKALEEQEIIPRVVPFDDLSNETLQGVLDGWDDLKDKLLPQ